MALREIRVFPDPVLTRRARDIPEVDDDIRQLMDDMIETMYDAPGVGLAAPQIGVSQQVIVVDISVGTDQECLIRLANPVILDAYGEEVQEEGCLSVPEMTVPVTRGTKLQVEGLDQDGNKHILEAEGLLARALQHEIDHLNGILIIDHLKGLKKEMIKKKLAKKSRKP